MGTILKNVVRFEGLVIDDPVSLPHLLNVNGRPVAPRIGGANAACFDITADATTITVTRTATSVGDTVDVYVEYWHTFEAVIPQLTSLTGLTPLFFASCGGGGGGAPTTEHVSGEGGVDPAVPLDPAVDTSFITNSGASETSQTFTLADGTVDGQIHNIVNDSTGIRGVTVTPANLRGGTSIGVGFANASAVLMWNDPAGEWVVLGTMLGFTLS